MSDDDQIPGQQSFEILAAGEPEDDQSRFRLRRAVAGGTVLVTGLAVAGWGVADALSSSATTRGFPHVTALSATADVSASSAASAVDKAVVDIDATDGYSGDADEGTGMIITSNGDVLTNNHVVRGATSVSVTLVSTGKTYRATVLGTDATDDVALLKLRGASGLPTIDVGDATAVTKGVAVAAVGNALGRAGAPTVTTGSITGTGRTITASDGDGSSSEQLSGLLETDADIVSGDSGGPLVDSSGQVIGMDTAASSSGSGGFGFEQSAITSSDDGYAIPITHALEIARKIAAGKASATIVIGTPGFLGLELASPGSESGVFVGGVVPNSPVARAGITRDDTVTSLNGTTVTTDDALTALLAKTHGGDRVTVGWVDASGASHQATVTLLAGPAA